MSGQQFGLGGGTTTTRRQRTDGTWTFTTPEYDAVWYWPVGTRIRLRSIRGVPAKMWGKTGTVSKQNSVSVRVTFDDPSFAFNGTIMFDALERIADDETTVERDDEMTDDDADRDPNDCPECGRSYGPHYTGPCEHN